MSGAYYNEHDDKAAAWLRELIKAGLIADGEVDERSIEDVLPNELAGFTQCHFFAGIGVWSYALRRAGWPDDRPVWTGSCPCQPFSAAGKGDGFADERHLWPAFYHLIGERRPDVVFGEQVASKDADTWIDLVHTDMEALGYAFGAVPFPSAGVGAPHIRDRLYWVAERLEHACRSSGYEGMPRAVQRELEGRGAPCGLADPHSGERDGLAVIRGIECDRENAGRSESCGGTTPCGESGRLADAIGCGLTGACGCSTAQEQRITQLRVSGGDRPACPTNGFWRAADWLGCRDGKWRPVEPGTFPLAHGAAARVGRLRGYGNAINAEAAKAFIESYLGI